MRVDQQQVVMIGLGGAKAYGSASGARPLFCMADSKSSI